MKVVVGLSGGVDSAVTAFLLKEKGIDVHCIYVRMMNDDRESSDAKAVADLLGLPFEILDYRENFEKCIIGNFVDEYTSGRTPNPCIICNRDSKWKAMLDFAEGIGAQYVATGHYARIEKLENGRFSISNSESVGKDQTYVLCRLSQEMLSKTIMPLGDYTKDKVRMIAKEIGLSIAGKPDSQDICFIPDNDHYKFLTAKSPMRVHGAGDFVSEAGEVIGRHKGIEAYTVGQRKGLNIAMGHPVYVSSINAKNNTVTLSDTDVYSSVMFVSDISEMGMCLDEITNDIKFYVRVRYAHRGETACVEVLKNENATCTLQVTFDNPVRAIAPGQAAVFYLNGKIMFAGTIR